MIYDSPAMINGGILSGEFAEREFPPEKEVNRLTDTEIIKLFNERSERAISEVSEKYGGSCRRIAENILKNVEDAKECVNDAFLKIWENIPPEQPNSLCAFAAKITRNTAIDRYRAERAEMRGGGDVPLIIDELAECLSDSTDVELTAERHEIIAVMNDYLGTLPAERRIAFISRYCLCESVKSIAERLGHSQNTVSVNLKRTRKGLLKYLKGKGFEI